MAKYKANTGLLGVNDRKEKETHPDYNGKFYAEKAGFYYLKGWKKETRDGSPLLSIAADYADDDKQRAAAEEYGPADSYQPKQPSQPTVDNAPF